MLTHSNATLNGGAATVTPVRVASIAILDTTFETIAKSEQVAVLFRILKRPIIQAEQRARAHLGKDIPAALMKIDVTFPFKKPANKSILGPLTTDYPALVRSLKVLMIAHNDFDDSAPIGAFAAFASHLRELTFRHCGLMSMRGLEKRCEYLRKVNLCGCKHLTSIGALTDRVYLEEVDASGTGITCIKALHLCPNLTKVNLHNCQQLSSIDALAGHKLLQEVDASYTGITSIEPLRTCPALTKVKLSDCRQISLIDALAGHQWLQEVDASWTSITSIEPLHACPNLTSVNISGCDELLAEVYLLAASVTVIQ